MCIYISHSSFNPGNASLFVRVHGCAVACTLCATKQTFAHGTIFSEGTLVVGQVCCAGCVGSNIGYCNNYIEHCMFDVNKALMLSL